MHSKMLLDAKVRDIPKGKLANGIKATDGPEIPGVSGDRPENENSRYHTDKSPSHALS